MNPTKLVRRAFRFSGLIGLLLAALTRLLRSEEVKREIHEMPRSSFARECAGPRAVPMAFALVLFLLTGMPSASAAQNAWTVPAPEGGSISGVATQPIDVSWLHAGASGGSFFKTEAEEASEKWSSRKGVATGIPSGMGLPGETAHPLTLLPTDLVVAHRWIYSRQGESSVFKSVNGRAASNRPASSPTAAQRSSSTGENRPR